MALKRGSEIATIDVALITVVTKAGTGGNPPATELALNTASKIAVTPQIDTQDAIKLISKGQLRAQKRKTITLTGNTIVLTDNLFNVHVVKVLQGGTIEMGTGDESDKVVKYIPPVTGSEIMGEIFETCAYSSIYNAAGLITGYEKITYPNCQGEPISVSSEDNVFRVSEYTITSAPNIGEAPYVVEYVKDLPVLA